MKLQKQVLVVEDNEINREILIDILSENYKVLEASNGREALDLLSKCKENISLILLDVMMPVMDGYTFLDEIKKDETLSLIPVIVMTQGDREEDELEALAHGATDFVPKPYRPKIILQRMASLIKLRETAALVNQVQYDRLTGVYNKEFFYRKVQEILNENPDQEYSVIGSNIENFKLYNDVFGREAGNHLLKTSAEELKKIVGTGGICGRYSADRFMILQERERERADRSRYLNDAKVGRPSNMKNVTVKWGVYEITDRDMPVEQMCDWAWLAADSIKGQYHQHIAVYDDKLRKKILREKAITDSMENALREGNFSIYFQPKYDVKNDCLAGAEALVRWKHPELGILSPVEFIPLFEKNGFIPNLDQYIWEKVCEKMQGWRDKGYQFLPVSVNISRADVYQLDLVQTLLTITDKYHIEPSSLHLEITESSYAENPLQIINTVNELRNHGFIIEMDDFGSVYSSLNMLTQMKMDVLKLDMKFIQNEMEKPAKESILSYIINMSHAMNLSVVAEGVETREQLERLKDLDCDYIQGYYYAKPMPDSEYEKMICQK